MMDKIKRKKRNFSSQNKKNYSPDRQLIPTHKKIDLVFDLEKKQAKGYVEINLLCNSDNVNKIKLQAYDFKIESISSDKDINDWYHDGKTLTVIWKKELKKENIIKLKINYQVSSPVGGMFFYYPDDKYPDRADYVFIDNEAEKARYWLPCIDHQSIKCTYEFILTANKKYTILANGDLIGEKINKNGTKTSHWEHKIPTPSYLVNFVIGNLINYKDKSYTNKSGKEIDVSYYSINNNSIENLKLSLGKTPEMIEWITKKLDFDLPYNKYYQYYVPHPLGAMENMSLVSWDDYYLLDKTAKKELGLNAELTNLHELAHTWFGNIVGCESHDHAWLKEGWATYMEAVWLEEKYSKADFDYCIYKFSEDYFSENISYQRAISTNNYDCGWDMFDRHLYQGAALRINMLRNLVGNELLWKATKNYLKEFQNKTAQTIDFQRCLEKHSGLNLTSFFEQWIYKSGYPKIKAEFEYDEDNKLTILKINQNQAKSSKEAFSFNLEINIEIAKDEFIEKNFYINKKEQTLFIPMDKRPKQIIFDPKLKLIHSLEFNPGRDLLNRTILNGTTVSKILAAKELANLGSNKSIKTILKAYKLEEYWFIKAEFIKSIAKIQSTESIKTLIEILESEKDERIFEYIVSTLGKTSNKFSKEALLKFLDKRYELYSANSNALKALANQDNKQELLEYFKKFNLDNDNKGIIEEGLYTAIGRLKTKESIEFLLEKLVYGKSKESVRESIISAICNSFEYIESNNLKDKVKKDLLKILKEETQENIIRSTIYGLESLEDSSLINSILMAKNKIELGEHPQIDRIIEKINKSGSSDEKTKSLKEAIIKLEEKNYDLVSRLEKLEAIINVKNENN